MCEAQEMETGTACGGLELGSGLFSGQTLHNGVIAHAWVVEI